MLARITPLALCVPAALVTANRAPAQSLERAWTADSIVTPDRSVLGGDLAVLDDGGSLFITALTEALVELRPWRTRIERRSRDGVLAWERTIATPAWAPFPFGGPPGRAFDASPSGWSAVVIQINDEFTLYRHSPDGTQLPDVVVQPADPNLLQRPLFVRIDAAGNTNVGVLERLSSVSPVDWQASIVRIDLTGQIVYRTELRGARDVAFDELPGGGMVMAVKEPYFSSAPNGRVEIRGFDAAGAATLSSTVTLPQPDSINELRHDAASGRTVFRGADLVSSVDAQGVLEWSHALEGPTPISLAFDAATGATWVGHSQEPLNLVRYDASGAPGVQVDHAGISSYGRVVPRPGGGLYGLAAVFGNEGAAFSLCEIDPVGALLSTTPVPSGETGTSSSGTLSYQIAGDQNRAYAGYGFGNGSIGPAIVSLTQTLRGVAGVDYCSSTPNSTGSAGRLRGVGTDVLAESRLSLVADQLPPGQFSMFVASLTPDFVPGAGGSQGNLCVGGAIGRFNAPGQIRAIGSAGTTSLEVDTGALPTPMNSVPANVGETWRFQLWFRDLNGGMPTSNFTNGLAVLFG